MNERLLIVEDDESNRKLLTYILEPYGYKVHQAINGEQALTIINEHKPDLVLMDIRLPDINGFEVCERMKSREETRDIPVIFTTALAMREHRVKGFELGAADFITKPYYREEIILRIENRLKLSRAEKELKETIENQSLLLDHIEPMVWYLTDPKTLGNVNKSYADFFNRQKEDVEHVSLEILLPPEEFSKCLEGNKEVFESRTKTQQQLTYTNGDGEKRLLAVTKVPKINNRGDVNFVICSAEDITEQQRKEEKIQYLTFHDPLTGLYNRTFYEEELKRLDVPRKLPLSIITCDVNGLKVANDIFGHQVGDELLVEVGKFLKKATRNEDIVARWGGDEFVVMLPNTSKNEAKKITERIDELMRDQTVELIPVSVACGSATKEHKEEDVKKIFNKAEDRMYRNKSDVKDNKEDALLKRFTTKFFGTEFHALHHTEEIQTTGKRLGEALNLNAKEQELLELLITYHDIGKITVPKHILEGETNLNDREWEQYKNHVEIGYRIAKSIPALNPVSKEILHHHEKFDGTGFPGIRQGKEIPYLSRILAVVDIYDGLRSDIFYPLDQDHCFKSPLSEEKAMEEILRRSGTFFDPEIVQAFMQRIQA